MAANILEFDKGICRFDTWHKLPQYECLPSGVDIDLVQAQNVVEYTVEKLPLYIQGESERVKGANALARKINGKWVVIYPSVGEDFTYVQTIEIFTFICNAILAKNPNIKLDSVGTLANGRICFMNLDLGEYCIKKDANGKTISKLMYAAAFGGKSDIACAHDIRVCCQNTANIAEAQGAVNNTLRRFGHYENINTKYQDYVVDLAEIYGGMKLYRDKLEHLADQQMSTDETKAFLNAYIPLDITDKKVGDTKFNNILESRTKLMSIFENAPDLQGEIKHTRYAMFQAVTNQLDHKEKKRNNNEISNWYDNVVGVGRNTKQMALNLLTTM